MLRRVWTDFKWTRIVFIILFSGSWSALNPGTKVQIYFPSKSSFHLQYGLVVKKILNQNYYVVQLDQDGSQVQLQRKYLLVKTSQ